jgi:hypothetical protein
MSIPERLKGHTCETRCTLLKLDTEGKPMGTVTARLLLALSALLSIASGAIHAAAFRKALAAIDGSDLPRFYAGSSKGLWLADSATLFILAILFCLIAARPRTATRPLVILVALIPATTAAMLYTFLGNFFAGHLLLVIAGLAFVAGLKFPRTAGSALQ